MLILEDNGVLIGLAVSDVAIGNFMNNGGNNEVIFTDSACRIGGQAGCNNANQTKMFSVSFNNGANPMN